VAPTEERREADPAEIVTCTPAEVEAIARAAAAGAHRDNRLSLTPGEVEAGRRDVSADYTRLLDRTRQILLGVEFRTERREVVGLRDRAADRRRRRAGNGAPL
jgi:hypothetical protein